MSRTGPRKPLDNRVTSEVDARAGDRAKVQVLARLAPGRPADAPRRGNGVTKARQLDKALFAARASVGRALSPPSRPLNGSASDIHLPSPP